MDAQDLDALRTRDYWEKRYNNEPPGHEFDWFKCYDDLAPWLNEIIHFEDTILMLGCGNSVRNLSLLGRISLTEGALFRALQAGLHKHPEYRLFGGCHKKNVFEVFTHAKDDLEGENFAGRQ